MYVVRMIETVHTHKETDMESKDLEIAAVQMAFVANGGDIRGVMAWALGLCCQCVEKMTDKKTATAFCLQMSDLIAEIVGRHEKAHYPEVTMDDIFDASRLDALDADGLEWRALCEIYRETSAPEITYENARAIDAAARHMRELGIADVAQLRRIMWQRLTDRSIRLKDIALTIGSGSDFSTAI